MKKIYADCNATTPLLQVVKEYLKNRMEGPFANSNALHSMGRQINQGVEKCREIISTLLGAPQEKERLIFTSGSSESISTAFWMTIGHELLKFRNSEKAKKHVICSTTEHASVIENAKFWESKGAIIHWVHCTPEGSIDLHALNELITMHYQNISLVAVMAANNETGVIQPFIEVAKICQKFGIYYLCDTTQIIGKIKLASELFQGCFFCSSSHKLGAPLGSGFLFLPHKENFSALIQGGGQEQSLRSGTQNYLGIECMTIALDYHFQNISFWHELKLAKEQFEKQLIDELGSKVRIISHTADRLSNTSLISFPGLHGQGLQIEMESRNIFVTTSAACADNEPETSQVLKAMQLDDKEGRSVVRISTGLENSTDDYPIILNALINAYKTLSKIN